MAVRTYVGSRYIPRFMGEYAATQIYEALDVVDNGLGTTYIAKKKTPAGTSLTDTEFWAIYGASSGAIIDLQTRMGTAEGDIDALESRADTAEGDIEDIFDALNTKQFNTKNRKFLFLGDSYYLGGTGLVYTGIGWAAQVINFLGLSESNYILATVDDIAPGGTTSSPAFYATAGNHRSFADILRAMVARLSQDDMDSVTDIVVCGGYNDKEQTDAILTGISDFATVAKTNFINADIWCGNIGWSSNQEVLKKLLNTKSYYRKAVNYGIHYIDNAEFLLGDSNYFISDGVHPTEAGYILIGRAIANGLMYCANSGAPLSQVYLSSFTYQAYDPVKSGNLTVLLYDSKLKVLVIDDLTFEFTSGKTVSYNSPIGMSLENRAIRPFNSYYFSAMVGYVTGTGTEYRLTRLEFYYGTNGLSFLIKPYGTGNITGVTQILIPATSIMIPYGLL